MWMVSLSTGVGCVVAVSGQAGALVAASAWIIAAALRHLPSARNTHFACLSSCIGLWDLVSPVTQISGEKIIVQISWFDQLLLQSLKPPSCGRWDKFLSLGTKPKHRYFLWCWMCFSSKTAAHRVLSCKLILFLLSKLNVDVNKVMHTLATCYGLPLNYFSCCLKSLNWKIFLPWPRSLHACCLLVFPGNSSVQFPTLSFLRPAPHFTVGISQSIFNSFKLNSYNIWDKDNFPYFMIVSQENCELYLKNMYMQPKQSYFNLYWNCC